MTKQEHHLFIEFCVDINETENCHLKIEERQRNIKAEAASLLILISYYGWFLGKHSF